MHLSIIRKTYTAQSTTGYLSLDGVFQCYTLEPSVHADSPCIAAGVYKGAMLFSEHFQRKIPHVLNVPGRTAIEIHAGNFPRDTHGCAVVGQTCSKDFVGLSDAALDALIAKLPQTFEVEVIDTNVPETT